MDKELQEIINAEQHRQLAEINLIPSENYTSEAVRAAVGSVAMHKYSEGYPGARYYEGNRYIDQLEELAIARARSVFKLPADWGVNVQPLSGSNANLAVYTALLEPGATIMGLYLPDGGHLSHGWQWKGNKVNITSKIYNSVFYNVDPKTELIDYDEVEQLALEHKPKLIISGGTAYPRLIDHEKFQKIARKVGAYYLADVAHEAGLIAARVYPSPVDIADVVTMTTHKTLRGPKGAMIMARDELMQKINKAIIPGMQGGPHNGGIAAIAQALFEASQPQFVDYQKQVIKNAKVLAELFKVDGYHVIGGGTDKHLVLVDTASSGIDGRKLATALSYAGIVVNKNTIPGEQASPINPSGIRLGTPFVTTLGAKEQHIKAVYDLVVEVIAIAITARDLEFKAFEEHMQNLDELQTIRKRAEDLMKEITQ